MLLKRAGDFLDQSWRVKWSKSLRLVYRPAVDEKVVAHIQALLKDWEQASSDELSALSLQRLTEHCRQGLHVGGEVSLMAWAQACHQHFNPPQDLQDELFQCHEVLHKRAVYVSALNVLFSLALGYHEPLFLRDAHRIGWLMDLGLVSADFSYWIALACQEEKLQPGRGIEFLRSKHASKAETELFLSHPARGHVRIKKDWEAHMAFPALMNSVLHHHELSDGSGFPAGLSRSALSDWESLVILADQLVDYRTSVLQSYATHGLQEIWQAFHRRQVTNCPVGYVWRRVGQWSANLEEAA